MPKDHPQPNDLTRFFDKPELIRQTAAQIAKDFHLHSEEITISGNTGTAYRELFDQIEPVIRNLADRHYEKLLSLLYTIDLDEKQISEATSKVRPVEYPGVITRMVIERALKKVLTREFFRKSHGNT